MSGFGGPNFIRDGLVLSLDPSTLRSFKGIPTTNLVANTGLSIYNNVSGDVSATLTQTSLTYRGAPIWRQTLTPTSANGVSWLSNANNPGIGVISNGGGGTANRFTGFSIFFRSSVPLASPPIYTNYSNIPGWQSCCNVDNMGDGWFRAHVIWFDTVTRSDGKYWAINPLSASLNRPIEILWAGPFKEDRNDSSVVSPYVNGTRGTTVANGGGWADISGKRNNGEIINNPNFTSSNFGGLIFDGVDDSITIPFNSTTMDFSLAQTICMWLRPGTGSDSTRRNPYNQAYGGSGTITHEPGRGFNYYFGTNGGNNTPYVGVESTFTVNPNELAFICVTRSQPLNICRWYKNGQLFTNTNAGGYSATNNGSSPILIANGYTSRFIGEIYSVNVYNRFFTTEEIQQMYNATKSRFGL